MAFGRSDGDDNAGNEGRIGGNRPDCAYFLLLGLCGAAFLLTIGGILTYIAFNPGSVDSRPHSPLSHIPHFHHHRKHHDRTEGHYFGSFGEHHDELKQQHSNNAHHQQQAHHPSQTSSSSHSNIHSSETTTEKITSTTVMTMVKPTMANNETRNNNNSNDASGTRAGESGTTPGNHSGTSNFSKTENKSKENATVTASSVTPEQLETEPGKQTEKGTNNEQQHDHSGVTHRNYNKNNSSHHHHPLLDPSSSHHLNQQQQQHNQQQMQQHPHPGVVSSITHHEGANSNGYEYQAKQSLALAIIGPLCLLMGIIVTLIVGVFALKYDCDHEPEPNIAFLRLRSEMSLNFDPSKNNYELLMPATSSSAGVGSTHSIHPGGMPRC